MAKTIGIKQPKIVDPQKKEAAEKAWSNMKHFFSLLMKDHPIARALVELIYKGTNKDHSAEEKHQNAFKTLATTSASNPKIAAAIKQTSEKLQSFAKQVQEHKDGKTVEQTIKPMVKSLQERLHGLTTSLTDSATKSAVSSPTKSMLSGFAGHRSAAGDLLSSAAVHKEAPKAIEIDTPRVPSRLKISCPT